MIKLSVVLATRNEEANIYRCLMSVKKIADEIIVFDEFSTDNTVNIAKSLGASVYSEPHHENFHITKQKAIEKAKGEWILQLDADEVVSCELAHEIKEVISMDTNSLRERMPLDYKKEKLLKRHIKEIERRDGRIGNTHGEIVAFFIPRKNMFLGKPLIHGGVYPDPAIRLIKKGKAFLPAKSVHEIMKVNGRVSFLYGDLEHYDSPTLRRYFNRLNRYTTLQAKDFYDSKVSPGVFGFILYVFVKPVYTFMNIFVRHSGYKDGMRGFMWASLSASHFPIAYFKYSTNNDN